MHIEGFCLVHLLQTGSRYTRLCGARHDIVFMMLTPSHAQKGGTHQCMLES